MLVAKQLLSGLQCGAKTPRQHRHQPLPACRHISGLPARTWRMGRDLRRRRNSIRTGSPSWCSWSAATARSACSSDPRRAVRRVSPPGASLSAQRSPRDHQTRRNVLLRRRQLLMARSCNKRRQRRGARHPACVITVQMELSKDWNGGRQLRAAYHLARQPPRATVTVRVGGQRHSSCDAMSHRHHWHSALCPGILILWLLFRHSSLPSVPAAVPGLLRVPLILQSHSRQQRSSSTSGARPAASSTAPAPQQQQRSDAARTAAAA